MKNFTSNVKLSKLIEVGIVSILSIIFLSGVISFLLSQMQAKPEWLDEWSFCQRIENQITRIMGLNPGGIWDGGQWYPFHKVSLLFDEPSWGVSLLVAPLWILTKNIFVAYTWARIGAIFLAWLCTYYFAKRLGANKLCAFYAAATFSLSNIVLDLVPMHCAFLPFFLIPLLGILTLKMFNTVKLYWGVFWGATLGYLAWSSAHLFLMGSLFLGMLILFQLLSAKEFRKSLSVILVGLIVAGIISGLVFIPMYVVQTVFKFSRGYEAQHHYATNFANLIYLLWPDRPLNFITQTSLGEYIATHAKGELPIGLSFLLLLAGGIIFLRRIFQSRPVVNKAIHSWPTFLRIITVAILLSLLNMYAVSIRGKQVHSPALHLAVGPTLFLYLSIGVAVFFLRRRIISAMQHLDYFLLLGVIIFGLFSFGPYYMVGKEQVIAAPVAFLQYLIPGFSGLQASSRWGVMISFVLSLAVGLFLSQYSTNLARKICTVIFIGASLCEVGIKFEIPSLQNLKPYTWTPRQVDIFLGNLTDNGAVLELPSYPYDQEQLVRSESSLGYAIFSRLYHKKPLVVGYSSYYPHVSGRYLFPPVSKNLSPEIVAALRKFGAKYWVLHVNNWSTQQWPEIENHLNDLKRIAVLDDGKTVVYQDSEPTVSVGPCDLE